MMFKTILVPLDGSKRAEAILPYVEEMARQNQGRLVLLEVIDPWAYDSGVSGEGLPDLYDELIKHLLQDAEAYLARIQGDLQAQGIETHIRAVAGAAVSQIMATARQEGADLIAMVSHGRTGLQRVFYGSVAAGVLHVVDRPLLLVRSAEG
jgi:nucleotide-binding universal stress UspA family protein